MNSKRAGYLHQNRHGVFYFRRAIPATISMHFTQREIYRSLRTTSRSNAIMRAQAFGIVTDLLFRKLRAMATNKNDKPIQMDMMMELDFEEGTLKLDVEPHEVEAGKDLITHALKSIGPLLRRGVEPAIAASQPAKLLSAAFGAYLDELENSGDHRPESILDYRGECKQFLQILGDVSVAKLQHEALNECKRKLMRLPPNINKSPQLRDKSIDEILALGLPAQSASTVRKKWSRLQAFFEWAVGQGYADQNYAKGKKPKGSGTSYEKFSDDDMAKLFESPYYANAEYEESFRYWIPLIGAYTGARLEEIAQLHLADIKCDVETGIWYFDITLEIDEATGAESTKNLKNESSVRSCPVHPTLLAAGLHEYVADLRARGYDRLFPELSVDSYGKCGARASEFFTEYRRKCVVGAPSGRSSKVFHSFRHTMNARLQKAAVDQEIRESLIGHTPQSTNVRVYGDSHLLQRLNQELGKLVYGFKIAPFRGSVANETARNKGRGRDAKRAAKGQLASS